MNQKITTQSDQTLDDESKALRLALDRLNRTSQSDWAKNIGKNESELIAKLFNLLATFIADVDKKTTEVVAKPIPNLLNKIDVWLQDKEVAPKASADLKKRLIEESEKLQKIAIDAKSIPVKSQTKNTKEVSSSTEASTQKNITKINNDLFQINESVLAIRSNAVDLLNLSNVNFPALIAAQHSLADLISEIPQVMTQELVRQNNLLQQDKEITSNKLDLVSLKLNEIQNSLTTRIHIRDSIEILEIRQEVERFVSADLIKKISLAVMPALEALKEAQPTEITKAVNDLNTRCTNAGLIPVEKLFL
jgi:hypothetical protein